MIKPQHPELKYVSLSDITPPDGSGARNKVEKAVKQLGMLSAIVLRWNTDDQMYEVVEGRRRYVTASRLGHGEIPAMILPDGVDGETMAAITLALNTQRSDNPLDESWAVKKLIAEGIGEKEIASRFGVPAATIKKRIKLLTLPPTILRGVGEGGIAVSVAETLVNRPPDIQAMAVKLYNKYGVLKGADVSALRSDKVQAEVAPEMIKTKSTSDGESAFRNAVVDAMLLGVTKEQMHKIIDE